jgi:hypothetical protein
MDWDTNTLAPAAPTEPAVERSAIRTVTRVVSGGPAQFGQAVQFEFEFTDGSRARLQAGCGDFPKIVSELRGFANLTERANRAGPDKPVEVVNPYQLSDARTDRVGPMIVVRCPTTDGLPLLFAMDANVAEKLIRGLERELAHALRQ